jgi:DNA-directed RNA polymerase sigma subunit (sigma70/sigma32)
VSPWKTSEEKINELCDRVVKADNDGDATNAIAELKDALRERIRQIKDRAFEVVPLISENRKIRKAATVPVKLEDSQATILHRDET